MRLRRNMAVAVNFILIILSLAGPLMAADAKLSQPAKVALIGFTVESGLDKTLADKLRLMLFAQIAASDNLEMLEREHLKKIMKEHNLSMSGLVSSKSQLRLGMLAGANFVLSGRVYKFNENIVINAKVVNAKTTRVFGLSRSYPLTSKPGVALEAFAKSVTMKLIKKIQKNNGRSKKKE